MTKAFGADQDRPVQDGGGTGGAPFLRSRVFALFALGYFVSYLYRGVNIGFAPFITRDLRLDAGDLGLLTSLYFLGFAAAQIPAGVLLDRFGARRTDAALLCLSAAGILVFGAASALPALMLGRLMIGVGVSVCFGGACKAIAQHFPVRQLPVLYGLVLATGGLGGVLVGTPLTAVLAHASWRHVCVGLSVLTLAAAALLMLGTPEVPEPDRRTSLAGQLRGTRAVLGSRFFWRVAPFSVATQGVFYAAQSLWAGAYMREVQGVAEPRAAFLASVIGATMMAGSVVFGFATRWLERRGLSVVDFSGLGMALFVADQVLIIAGAPVPPFLLWAAYGFFGGTGILTYAVLTEAAPVAMVGRVNTSLTLLLFVTIFAVQAGIGVALGLAAGHAGHHPATAHRLVWGALVLVQLACGAPYLARRARAGGTLIGARAPNEP